MITKTLKTDKKKRGNASRCKIFTYKNERSEKIIRRLEDVSDGMVDLAREMSEQLDKEQDEESKQNEEHET